MSDRQALLRVMVVIGTRPEAIKMAPVTRALQGQADSIQVRVCATGQHRELLDQALGLFGIVPDVDLHLMQVGQTPGQVGSRVLAALEPVLLNERPDWVLVQGDTTTVVAAAMCAHYSGLRVGHVEAGLRSFDRANPFPEETNRVLVDHLADMLFAPTDRACANLAAEGIPRRRIRVTGNTVVDALQQLAAEPWQPAEGHPLCQLDPARRWVLVTAHRRENFGAPLRRICAAVARLAARGDVQIICPVHLNPSVQGPVRENLGHVENVLLLAPLDYRQLIHVMKRSSLILTDSGGIQEEAPSLGVPVLVLRAVTERPEAVEAGVARLVGTGTEEILAAAQQLLDDPQAYAAMARRANVFGDGHAAERIVAALLEE